MTLRSKLDAWAAREPLSAAAHTVLAAHGLAHGRDNRITVWLVVSRPGPADARYRALRVLSELAPDDASEHGVLETVAAWGSSLGARLSVRPPGSGCAVADVEWIEAQGPAPLARWTVAWSATSYSADGRASELSDERIVEARTAHEALAAARAGRPEVIGRTVERVLELDDDGSTTIRLGSRRAGALDRHDLRRLAIAGRAPTDLLDRLGAACPRDAMHHLAEAWCVELGDVEAASAYLRGEMSREEADLTLGAAAAKNDRWRFHHHVREAIAADVVTPDLLADARSRGGVALHIALRDVTELSFGEAKEAVDALSHVTNELAVPGVLGTVLRSARRGG